MVRKAVKALDALKQGVQGLNNYLLKLRNDSNCEKYEVDKAREGLLRGDALITVASQTQNLPENSKSVLEEVKKTQEENYNLFSQLRCEE